jgi:hypothetical protein
MVWAWVLGLALALQIGVASPGAAAPVPTVLEKLEYQVSLGVWDDVARARVTFTALEPGRYQAEFTVALQGAWRLLDRWLPERYRTEMVYRQGRLLPLLYREEFRSKGKRIVKEFRFDYDRATLELWRNAGGRGFSLEWRLPLKEPMYDPLTFCYNLRLGVFGELPSGETLRVAGIPFPDPWELVFRVLPGEGASRQVRIMVREKISGKESGPYFVNFDPELTPQNAWTRVLLGKLGGQLLAGQQTMTAKALAAAVLKTEPAPLPAAAGDCRREGEAPAPGRPPEGRGD